MGLSQENRTEAAQGATNIFYNEDGSQVKVTKQPDGSWKGADGNNYTDDQIAMAQYAHNNANSASRANVGNKAKGAVNDAIDSGVPQAVGAVKTAQNEARQNNAYMNAQNDKATESALMAAKMDANAAQERQVANRDILGEAGRVGEQKANTKFAETMSQLGGDAANPLAAYNLDTGADQIPQLREQQNTARRTAGELENSAGVQRKEGINEIQDGRERTQEAHDVKETNHEKEVLALKKGEDTKDVPDNGGNTKKIEDTPPANEEEMNARIANVFDGESPEVRAKYEQRLRDAYKGGAEAWKAEAQKINAEKDRGFKNGGTVGEDINSSNVTNGQSIHYEFGTAQAANGLTVQTRTTPDGKVQYMWSGGEWKDKPPPSDIHVKNIKRIVSDAKLKRLVKAVDWRM